MAGILDYVQNSGWLSAGFERLKYDLFNKSAERGALESASGYAISDQSYPLIVDIIKFKYGKPKAIFVSLHAQLKSILSLSNSREIKTFVEKVEKCLRQLEALKSKVNHEFMESFIESKLPQNILMKVY